LDRFLHYLQMHWFKDALNNSFFCSVALYKSLSFGH
jgi:hypothetical protein